MKKILIIAILLTSTLFAYSESKIRSISTNENFVIIDTSVLHRMKNVKIIINKIYISGFEYYRGKKHCSITTTNGENFAFGGIRACDKIENYLFSSTKQ